MIKTRSFFSKIQLLLLSYLKTLKSNWHGSMEIFSLRLITNEKEGFSLFFFYSFFSFLLCGWSLNDDWTFQWNLLGRALFYFTSVLLLSIFIPTVVLWFDDNQKSLFFYIPLLLPFRDVTMEPNPFWSFIWIFTDFILSNLTMNI